MACSLVEEARAHDGLAPIDLENFWADDEIARRDPFGRNITQVPFGASLNHLCVFAELGVAEDVWRYEHDEKWRLSLNRAYNDRAEVIVGKRILPEEPGPAVNLPPVGQLHDVFEASNEWHGWSWWLKQSARTPDELRALLDRVETRDIRKFILPENWEEEKSRLGIKPQLYRAQRGPVTFAMSVYGVENLIFLILEEEKLAARFRDAILRVMLEIARVMDEEAGYAPGTAPGGFQFNDDNCAMLNAPMYEFFGYPIVKGVFDRYCPDRGDYRGQHSDSAMEHLLPMLGRLAFTWVNFGPTLTVAEIREHLPRAVISGQLAPFTYMRNDSENIVMEFLRDFEMTKEKRGLSFATAGSISQGTRLASMRLAMAAIQRFVPVLWSRIPGSPVRRNAYRPGRTGRLPPP
jgi:uroporphyrinogen decarboxylase